MADEISKVAYYLGAIPNKAGEGVKVLSAFQEAGVNLAGFLGYPKGRKSEVILIVDEKAPAAGPVAKKAGLALGKKGKAFLVNGEDRPGALAEVMGKISAAGVNIQTVHALCAGVGRWGALISVEAADLRKAAKALGI